MEENLKPYRTFTDSFQAYDYSELLSEQDIKSKVIEISSPIGSSFGDSGKQYELQIRTQDFEKADKVFENLAKEALRNIEKDHYLFQFSNDELFEIQIKPNEWNEVDRRLSLEILKNRLTEQGKDSRQELEKLWNDHVLSQPEDVNMRNLKHHTTSARDEIIIRNSKLKILLKYGFIFGLLLLSELLWGVIEQFKSLYEENKLIGNSLIVLFACLLVFGIVDFFDRVPKLRISKDGITLANKKWHWSAISKMEIVTTFTKHDSFDFLIVKPNNRKEIRIEITELNIEKENLKGTINKLSGIDFF